MLKLCLTPHLFHDNLWQRIPKTKRGEVTGSLDAPVRQISFIGEKGLISPTTARIKAHKILWKRNAFWNSPNGLAGHAYVIP